MGAESWTRALAPPNQPGDEMIYLIGLWANVLPGLLLLLLVWRVAERFEPGYGAAAAVTLGLGTMVLPLSTLLFSHVFTAFLGFAAFALMLHEREGPPSPMLLGAGGRWRWAMRSPRSTRCSSWRAVLGLYLLSRGDALTPPADRAPRGRLHRGRHRGDRAAAALQPLRVPLLDAPGLLEHPPPAERASSGSRCRA